MFVKMLSGASHTRISLKPSHLQCQQSLSLNSLPKEAGEGREQLLTWLCKSSSLQHHLRGH